ncbi:MAG: hypothetical protein VB120_06780 [Lachnospiraceae bacterium]|nr:hypothetical protein [Lachnospiraceae bacterium]
MKSFRNMSFLILAVIVSLGLQGCSEGKIDSEIKDAITKTNSSKSYSSEINIETQITDGENTGTSVNKYEMETLLSPSFIKKITSNTYYQDEQTSTFLMYICESENHMEAFINYGDAWARQLIEKDAAESDLAQYDAALLAGDYLEYTEGFEEKGEEEGYKIYKGIIKPKNIKNAIEAAGTFKSTGIEVIPNSYFSDLKGLEVIVYVDSEGRLAKFSVDVAEVMQLIFEQAYYTEEMSEYKDVKYSKMLIYTYIYNFDGISEIAIPDEAINAKEFSEDFFEESGLSSDLTEDEENFESSENAE